MRMHHLAAGIAAAALIPTLAMAQETCEQRSANRAAGTAVGAVAGALLGSAVAGHGHKGDGAIVGGVAGAVVGNQASRGPKDCVHAYGWYDNDGRWHGQRVDERYASGYYDRNGAWIDGRPAGHYDRGVWIADADDYGRNAAYETREHSFDIDGRIARMDQWIDNARDSGRLSRRDARNAMNTLNDIRRDERYRSYNGRLSDRDQAMLQTRLDRLGAQIRYDVND